MAEFAEIKKPGRNSPVGLFVESSELSVPESTEPPRARQLECEKLLSRRSGCHTRVQRDYSPRVDIVKNLIARFKRVTKR